MSPVLTSAEAAAALERGEVVALPTETVRGLAARADDAAALARLCELKGSAPDRPFALLLPDIGAVSRYGDVKGSASGLLFLGATLLLGAKEGAPEGVVKGGKVGVRLPDAPVLQSFLSSLPFPVAATSANRAGEKPCGSPEELARVFPEVPLLSIPVIPRGEPSSLLDMTASPPTLERRGAPPLSLIESTLGAGVRLGVPARVLIICTGNICRSQLARSALLSLAPETEVRTGGLGVVPGLEFSPDAVKLIAERGLPPPLRARPVSAFDVDWADVAYAMEEWHAERLRTFTQFPEKVQLLGGGIEDPWGRGMESYVRALGAIEAALKRELPSILRR